MSVETPKQVEEFLLLQSKKESELQAMCEAFQLDTAGNKADLIDRLVSTQEPQYQRNPARPQAIPLRTRGPDGKPLPHASEVFKQWRKAIFHGKKNLKSFTLINSRGQDYQQKLRYAKCSPAALKVILENHWYMAHTSQRELVNLLNSHPENFSLTIVQKPDSQGNSWLMLHCEPKAA